MIDPAPEPEPQGDADGDGVRNADDPDYEPPPAPEDTPETPARGPVDSSDFPPTPANPDITAAAQDYRDSQATTVNDGGHRPRERDIISTGNAFSNQQAAPRRGGRGKAERRRQMRFNSGTGRPIR